jgi:hypothetical protein
MKNHFKSLLGASALAVLFAGPVLAQVPSLPPPPYNVDLSQQGPNVVPLITNTARAPATTNSATLTNLAYAGVLCTFNQTAASGSPSTTIEIDMFDSASQTFQLLAISGASANNNLPVSIVVSPAIQTSSLPARMVALQMHLPSKWRVSQVQTGANTTSTGTVGCNYLK